MTDADIALGAMRGMVENNMSEEGIDLVNIYSDLINALKTDPAMTIEYWELTKMSIVHGAAISCNLIDQEIARMKEEQNG